MKKILLISCLMSVLLFSKCLNSYESKAIGNYEVNSFKLTDSLKKVRLPTLTLFRNKTFIINYSNHAIAGNWKADDAGDWTLINFDIGKGDAQGILSGGDLNFIKIQNPYELKLDDFSSLEFRRK